MLEQQLLEISDVHIENPEHGKRVAVALRSIASRTDIAVAYDWSLIYGGADMTDPYRIVLRVGIDPRNQIGAMQFGAADHLSIPATGGGDGSKIYKMAGKRDMYFQPGCQLSLGTVLDAVDQFVLTRTRPALVAWRTV
ncbi:Imm1 family immunity protein [Prauserella endophytica]|uniref:Uncharacterized protein n=1 Tax=Prauserella endophytica TaxID=1592324 RepID=A0ABY2RS12_9PSEU|nr:Imm1 family immunity protein [Prauserella endophytica]TKG57749.1 hypothetical protein FCN18_38730 [Prauserella endophytica]